MDIDKFNEFFDEEKSNEFFNEEKAVDTLNIAAQIYTANNKLHKAIDNERYLDAAKYRDLLIELKAKRDEKQ